ncbi:MULTISPECIES: hypothetical protein [unclassified Clostridium]|nr:MULTISPECIES: hypothetical protein [unclassified Clostridium]
MLGTKINYQMSDYQVEKRARNMGMEYPEEAKVILNKEVKK